MGLFVRFTRIGQTNPSDNCPHATRCTTRSCTTPRLRITPFAVSNPSALPSAVTILQQLDDCAGNATQDAANRPRNPENSSPKTRIAPKRGIRIDAHEQHEQRHHRCNQHDDTAHRPGKFVVVFVGHTHRL